MSAHSEETQQFIEAAPIVLQAGADAVGQRLDQWLVGQLGPDMSRSRVQMLIRQGAVSIGGKVV
ncbi:RNA pseudouridine synthase, partial [Mesorhizobium sp. M2D.F.Ca.ET.178.01.1.1]